MPRTRFDDALVIDGHAFMEHTEDGPQETWRLQVVIAVGDDGYVHPHVWRPNRQIDAEAFLARVKARGTADLAEWIKLEPRTSLEDRWDAMAQQEDEVRHGMRSEDDLYHGIPYR